MFIRPTLFCSVFFVQRQLYMVRPSAHKSWQGSARRAGQGQNQKRHVPYIPPYSSSSSLDFAAMQYKQLT